MDPAEKAKKDAELEASVSKKFLAKFGPEWEQARVCENKMKKKPWTQEELWVEKKWAKEGLVYLDQASYEHVVFNAPKDSKPWIIDILSTPLGGRKKKEDVMDNQIFKLVCMVRYLSDKYNVGFADYGKSENFMESYDFEWGKYAKVSPLHLLIKDNTLY